MIRPPPSSTLFPYPPLSRPRLVGKEAGHHGHHDRHREPVAQEEPEVGLDPALGDHRPPSCSPRRRSVAPSSRKTSPSAPTARPRPPGPRASARIQFAASWMGSGSSAQLAPPSVDASTVPELPTIHPCRPCTTTS